jgi:FdrA protein
LLGFDGDLKTKNKNIFLVKNLSEAAKKAAKISGISAEIFSSPKIFPKKKGKVFGLFCGGTLASEAAQVLGPKHEVIDFGDDEYTKGRPHPMIDPRIRNEAFLKFSCDKNAAVFLFDIVLGYGSHSDPAGNLLPIISQIKNKKDLTFIASVCGCEEDPQGYSSQVKKLKSAGVIIAPSNLAAARLAISIIS